MTSSTIPLSSFCGKKVLVTGHTGFKGSWLACWLKQLGARVVGVALDPPTQPSLYVDLDLSLGIEDYRFDIRNCEFLKEILLDTQPDFVFHLAAQPLVRDSYENPLKTWSTNVLGTVNLLEGLRGLHKKCTAVIITSDKCYDNAEWVWGYRETDPLGGIDPYSASKGCAEIASRSYFHSYFSSSESLVRLATARAGNVIGGGDWAIDRIVPDCVRSWSRDSHVDLRSPRSTRPWQHVLEPISGYLSLALSLDENICINGESFNFGPANSSDNSVLDLVREMSKHWPKVLWRDVSNKQSGGAHESRLLKLNCDKALFHLGWHSTLDFEQTVKFTAEWYRSYFECPGSAASKTREQIMLYTEHAIKNGLPWAK